MTNLVYIQSKHFENEHPVPKHAHSCWEMVYYVHAKGVSSFYGDNEKTTVISYANSTFALIPPHLVHDELSEPNCKIFAFGFQPAPELTQRLFSLACQTHGDVDFSIFKQAERIVAEYEEKKFGWVSQLDCLLHSLLVSLIRQKYSSVSRASIDYAINYINQYYMTEVNLNELAAESGFSPTHFRVLFKERLGVSPKQYVLNLRLERICDLLSNSILPLSQVAFETGFPDYYHFSAFFKSKTGVSPKDYRKTHLPKFNAPTFALEIDREKS